MVVQILDFFFYTNNSGKQRLMRYLCGRNSDTGGELTWGH
ncbi:unnamed protein product [Staurois parvus]|uniref:Uncharacterized protein n=1 Tax=Staurois parvus TaxID=386267 RepID=A0ABN9DLL7_9NEOB|nr:unnamed protein product [Staurois parvus]